MTAGIKTLELLKQPGTYEKLAATTETLINGIKEAAKDAGLPITGGSVSAMFGFFLCEGPVRSFEEAKAADAERFGELHRAMLERGVYLAPSAFEAGFTSLAHSEADIETTLNAFRESFLPSPEIRMLLLAVASTPPPALLCTMRRWTAAGNQADPFDPGPQGHAVQPGPWSSTQA